MANAFLSPARAAFSIIEQLSLLTRGKIRDTYELPNGEHLLMVTSDGLSIFDYVLNINVPCKGYVLNMMSVHWFEKLEAQGIRTHFVATGKDIDTYLPEELRGNSDLQARSMVVKKAVEKPDYEFIYRNVLTGSSVPKYKKDGAVCGIPLPAGLQDGDELPYPLFTPTTKADVGHDENVPEQEVINKYPDAIILGYKIFLFGTSYARKRGILVADSKFEFGYDSEGNLMLIDEVLSPDSSRFWELIAWLAIQKKTERSSPPPFDKEVVRTEGKKLGINDKNRSPENEDDHKWVWKQTIPEDLINQTTQRYRYIFWRLTGMTVEDFASRKLGVTLARPCKNVVVLVGSKNDLTPEFKSVIRTARIRYSKDGLLGNIDVHAMSVHRNTYDCVDFADSNLDGIDLSGINFIIAAAGWANQLAGMMDAFLHHNDVEIPVIGLAIGEPGSKEFMASKLSIECLPSYPVVMNEMTGDAYCNVEGLTEIFARLASGELPPAKPRKEKPTELFVDINN